MSENNYFDFDAATQPMNTPSQPTMSMKWHKFLIYFLLWVNGLMGFVNFYSIGLGGQYDGEASFIYRFYSGLQIVDILFGVLLLAVGVGFIVCRFQLAGYRASGVRLLPKLYLANVVIQVVYLVVAAMIADVSLGDLFTSQTIGSLVGGVAWAFINKSYYDKRSHLFTR